MAESNANRMSWDVFRRFAPPWRAWWARVLAIIVWTTVLVFAYSLVIGWLERLGLDRSQFQFLAYTALFLLLTLGYALLVGDAKWTAGYGIVITLVGMSITLEQGQWRPAFDLMDSWLALFDASVLISSCLLGGYLGVHLTGGSFAFLRPRCLRDWLVWAVMLTFCISFLGLIDAASGRPLAWLLTAPGHPRFHSEPIQGLPPLKPVYSVEVPWGILGLQWSPDSSTVLATVSSGWGNLPSPERQLRRLLILVRPDGTKRLLTPETVLSYGACWGPDGKSLFFLREPVSVPSLGPPGSNHSEWHATDAPLTLHRPGALRYVPNSLCQFELSSGKVTWLAPQEKMACFCRPLWSQSAGLLAVLELNSEELRLYSATAGEKPERLLPSPPSDVLAALAWSPDGKWLLATGTSESGFYLLNLVAGQWRYHELGFWPPWVDWMPDSRTLVVARGEWWGTSFWRYDLASEENELLFKAPAPLSACWWHESYASLPDHKAVLTMAVDYRQIDPVDALFLSDAQGVRQASQAVTLCRQNFDPLSTPWISREIALSPDGRWVAITQGARQLCFAQVAAGSW